VGEACNGGYEYVSGWGKVDSIFEGDESGKPSRLIGGIVGPSKGWIPSVDLYNGQIALETTPWAN